MIHPSILIDFRERTERSMMRKRTRNDGLQRQPVCTSPKMREPRVTVTR